MFNSNSTIVILFQLLGYYTPLNVKEARQMVEEGVSRGQAVDQDVMAFMYALGVGYEANQARANLYWSFAALGGSVLGNMALGYRYAKGIRHFGSNTFNSDRTYRQSFLISIFMFHKNHCTFSRY